MGSDGVFPAEMPERGPALIDALDDNTAERLVRGRVSPDDAPPGYAGVARVLQAAAGPAVPEELAGQESATATFRAYGPAARTQGQHGGAERRRPGDRARPLGRAQDRLDGRGRGRLDSRGRGRVVALALAGVVVAGGLWTAAGAPSPAGLPSRAGAPQSGGAGSGAPGSLTQARPMTPPVTGAGANARAPVQPPAPEPSTGNGGGPTASRASGHGAKEHRPGKPPKPKPKPKPKPEQAKPEEKPKPEHRSRAARR
jgi:hypothetical protein